MLKVSVIVPNYNHAPFLQQRIDSILNQTFQDFELIILDDCSTDNSRDVIEYYRNNPHVSGIVYNDENSGSAFRQWARGIELAKGDWIWIAESDDWAELTFLEVMAEEGEKHPKCGLVFSVPHYVYPNGEKWNSLADGKVVEYSGRDFACQRMVCANPIHNVSCVLFRRKDLLRMDMTSCSTMRLCGDWLLYAKLCKETGVLEVKQVLSNYRIHASNTSANAEKQGLSFIEGARVLRYLKVNFDIKSHDYARCWGREWAKQERQYKFNRQLRRAISHCMHPFPSVCFWHMLYKLKIW